MPSFLDNLETKTSKAFPTDVTTYQWDAQDQLIQIDFPNGTTASYKYDGLGRRIEKNVNGTITRYIYDGEDIALEYDGTNTFVARYTHGDRIDQPLAVQRAGVGFFYYHADHQGSIINLTDSSGMIANAYVYDSYGRRLSVFESVLQPFSYTGREFDAESRLYYYRARYYEPQTGRFLSEDPIGFRGGDANLYRYVFNNPVNLVDPSGTIPPLLDPGAPNFDPGVAEGGSATSPPPENIMTPFGNDPSKPPGNKNAAFLLKRIIEFLKNRDKDIPEPNNQNRKKEESRRCSAE